MSFSSFKNPKLKVKLWRVGARERKRGHFLHRLFCSKEIFLTFVFYLNVQCVDYTFRICTLLYIKNNSFIQFCCLFLRSSKALSVSLKELRNCKSRMVVIIFFYSSFCLSFLCFLPVLCRIRCKLYILYIIINIITLHNQCFHSRYQVLCVFVLTFLKQFVKTDMVL